MHEINEDSVAISASIGGRWRFKLNCGVFARNLADVPSTTLDDVASRSIDEKKNISFVTHRVRLIPHPMCFIIHFFLRLN